MAAEYYNTYDIISWLYTLNVFLSLIRFVQVPYDFSVASFSSRTRFTIDTSSATICSSPSSSASKPMAIATIWWTRRCSNFSSSFELYVYLFLFSLTKRLFQYLYIYTLYFLCGVYALIFWENQIEHFKQLSEQYFRLAIKSIQFKSICLRMFSFG